MSRILVIDDDGALCRSLELQLGVHGYTVRCARCSAEGLQAAAEWPPLLVVLDLHLPDEHGLSCLEHLLQQSPGALVVILTGDHDTRTGIAAVRAGAFDYLRKPLDIGDLLAVVERAEREREGAGQPDPTVAVAATAPAGLELVGSDRRILAVIRQIGLLSQTRVPVLIQGESGTGKELVARMLHEAGSPGEPFVAINCAAVVPTLLETEFFGHEKGSFTGAESRKTGQFEHAGAGTLFLDEIGELPLTVQAKLLRVLQQEEFVRVGGLDPIRLHARVVAASNRNLDDLVAERTFRKDLYYRLAVSTIHLPPLRERPADLPLLVGHLLGRIREKLHRPLDGIEVRALDHLAAYHWPGNVRELENVLTRAAAVSRSPVLREEHIVLPQRAAPLAEHPDSGPPQAETLEEAEKRHVQTVLEAHRWNITRSARSLGISPTTLRKKISDYDLRTMH